MNIGYISKNKIRVLVVDDDPRVQKDLHVFLGEEGYTVVVPQAQGIQLYNEAVEQAKTFRPHIAIVDISLNDSATDRSGVELLQVLQSARCILYSGKLNWDLTREIQRRYPKATWVDKEEQFQKLLNVVKEKAAEVSAIERKITIHKTKGWSEMVIKALLGSNTTAPANLVDDVFAQLFPNSTKIVLEALDQSIVTPQSVSRGRSVVMKAFHDERFEPYIVKIATADAIEREVKNYKEYIEGNLVGRFNASLVGETIFWDLGGVLYSFLDHADQKLISFRDYYEKHSDIDVIVTPLRHFYTATWRKLYEQSENNKETIGDYYNRVFHLDDRIKTFPNKDDEVSIPGISISIPNPVQWLNKHDQDSSGLPYRLSVTHGDLHSDNLFVDSNYAWVIDFERSGPGHRLRDFIEMEVDIFTRLGPGSHGNEWNSELLLAGMLITSKFDFPLETNIYDRITDPRLKKSLAVIQRHRKICAEVANFSDFREYLWGLLFDLVFLAVLIDQNKSQRDRALLLGGVICERLKIGNIENWPPEHLLKSVSISEETLPKHDKKTSENASDLHNTVDIKIEKVEKRQNHLIAVFIITIVTVLLSLWGISYINPSPWILVLTSLILLPIAIIFAVIASGGIKGEDGLRIIRDIVISGLKRFTNIEKDKDATDE